MLAFFKKYRGLIIQISTILAVLIFLFIIGNNYVQNISNASRSNEVGFGFLDDTAGFAISQSLIDYQESDTYGRTFIVSLLNTIVASVIGIILATILGFILGLMRLSHNWLAAKSSYGIIETLRNIPPLLHVLFWYQVVFLRVLPEFRNDVGEITSWQFPFNIYVDKKGITFPEILGNDGNWYFWVVLVLCLGGLIFLSWFKQREIQHGRHHKFWPWRLGIIALPILLIVFANPFYAILPVAGRFRYSGVPLRPELFSIVIALSTYTASYIAEIVRNSIIGVNKGQIEAAQSLGFTRIQQLRLIIVPQALRTMVPPVTNQYLNLIKNTSLGVAIAYPDLTAVFAGTALNQSGRALEIMFMVMMTYLVINLITSFFMNIYNKKIIEKKGRNFRLSYP
jgi:general L-amino acid transport system permease protein